jgi:hypothetical protein
MLVAGFTQRGIEARLTNAFSKKWENLRAAYALWFAFYNFCRVHKTLRVMAYLCMMAVRMLELHRVLKSTGSLYLHCDPTASHYLKILVDSIFGATNFKNEIIWKRTSAQSSTKGYGAIHDTILFYGKTDLFKWKEQYGPYDEQYVEAFFTHVDDKGRRWRRTDLTGPGVRSGDSGLPWRDYNPTAVGRHWQPPSYFYDKYTALTGDDLAKHH